jgi:hypothetical protein
LRVVADASLYWAGRKGDPVPSVKYLSEFYCCKTYMPASRIVEDPNSPIEKQIQSGDFSELAPRLPCKGKSVRNRGVSQTIPFLVIPRSLLQGGCIETTSVRILK